MSAATGGPAFPGTEANGLNSGCPGMTLRDYFMAHAPVEPHPWFRPVVSDVPVAPAAPADLTLDELDEYRRLRDKMDIEDCQQPRMAAFGLLLRAYFDEVRAHHANFKKQTYVQWPAAWADEMLKARAA